MPNNIDVCLLVEGAYPYVTGGVSSWVHALISNLPEISFALVHLGARPDPRRKMLYKLPDNVVEFSEVFINDSSSMQREKSSARLNETTWQGFQQLHQVIARGAPFELETLRPILQRPGFAGLHPGDLFSHRKCWDLLVDCYHTYASDQPFKDFFWTFRYTYLPILTVFDAKLPEAQIYHAVSTGFCGLAGALQKIRYQRPFLLTEHGLYTREREIEIMQSDWITQPEHSLHVSANRTSFFQEWWLNIYRFMETLSYQTADDVISITGVNQYYQERQGASRNKLRLIPNGIKPGTVQKVPSQDSSFKIGFVGRIVPIKDVKTCIRAINIARQSIPQLEAFFIGPTDEDRDYYQECLHLVQMLQLEDVVHFTGPADVRVYYQKLDVVVLTSVSEGQPLVILEANAAGIPVVATNVGACMELLQGITADDRALGPSGLITPVVSPIETAKALQQLAEDEELRRCMGEAGKARTARYYSQEQLYDSYQQLYNSYIA